MSFSGFRLVGDPPRTDPPELTWTVGSGQDYETLVLAIAAAKTAWASKVTLSLTDSTYTYDPDSESLADLDKKIIIKSANIEDWEGMFYLEQRPIPEKTSFSGAGSGFHRYETSNGITEFFGDLAYNVIDVGTQDNPVFPTDMAGHKVYYQSRWAHDSTEFGINEITTSDVGESNEIDLEDSLGGDIGAFFFFFMPRCTITLSNPLAIANSNVRFENLSILADESGSTYLSAQNSIIELKNIFIFDTSTTPGSVYPTRPLFENCTLQIEEGVLFVNALECWNCKLKAESEGYLVTSHISKVEATRALFYSCEFQGEFRWYSNITSKFASLIDCKITNLLVFFGNGGTGSDDEALILTRSDGDLSGECRGSEKGIIANGGSRISAAIDLANCVVGYRIAQNSTVVVAPISATSTTSAYDGRTSGVHDEDGVIYFS